MPPNSSEGADPEDLAHQAPPAINSSLLECPLIPPPACAHRSGGQHTDGGDNLGQVKANQVDQKRGQRNQELRYHENVYGRSKLGRSRLFPLSQKSGYVYSMYIPYIQTETLECYTFPVKPQPSDSKSLVEGVGVIERTGH